MRFGVLGPLEASGLDGPLPLGGPKQRLVLAHLVLGANKVVSIEQLTDAVWGEDLPEDPRSTVQTYVSRLRSVLGTEGIEKRAPGYVLRAGREEVDALRFEDLLAKAWGNGSEPRATDRILTEALELWRGPALADLAHEPSLAGEIARLEELRLRALEERFDAELDLGRHASVVPELEHLTRSHPLRERLWGELMLALYRCDRQGEALAIFDRARTILSEELGIDPSAELRLLHERILHQDPDLDLKGEPLRGYRLLEQIGEGAFGVVYRAIQPQIGREVAIKAVPPELANHPDFVRRFEREAQTVARLEHPHIVPLYDYWREPDAAYLVMRFLRGGSVEELLKAGPLEPERAASILDQVAAALSAAHRQGVVHRDVKPGNVLLDDEGNAYLTDFGVALDAGSPERSSGTMIRGTPGYLSPEQVRLDPASGQSDIYALGIVAYEMLTGSPPFPEASMQELLDRHLRDPIPSVYEVRPDLPASFDRTIARATAKDARDRFSDAQEFAAAFRAALEGAPVAAEVIGEIRNPYKGLRAFLEADAADFFGRETVTRRLLGRLEEAEPISRFLGVVGPSGSGKSSVVRAGLVPALRRGALSGSERWFVIDLLPGPHPMRELESALLGLAVEPPPSLLDTLEGDTRGLLRAAERILPDPDAELLIVLDQLEEVFTLVGDEDERLHILESLRAATQEPGSRVRVVATLRADFFDQPLSVRGFGDLLAERTEAVTPMSPEELERAIVAPAERAGLTVEPRLLAAMIADVVDQPGGLPLLQFALTELAERREDGVLTLAGYRRVGGISGALARRAEQIFEALNEPARDACRQLLLRLVTLGEGGDDTRRRVRRSELRPIADGPTVDGVLEAFGRHRLLSFDRDPASREPTVEIAHEALLGGWDRLRGWVDDVRDDIRTQRKLASAVAEWEAAERDPSFLLRDARLAQVKGWADTTTLALSEADRAYVEESTAVQRAAEERERALERRSIRRLRGIVAAVTAAALVASVLTAVAVDQRSRAGREARLASARELAAAAVANLAVDPERSVLLAIEAVELARPVDGPVPSELQEVLHQAVVASRIVVSVPGVGGPLDWSPGGDAFATEGSDGSGIVEIRDAGTGRSIRSFPAHAGDITDVAFSPDGSMLATTGVDGFLKVWNPANGELLDEVAGVGEGRGPSFSQDGRLVAAAWPEEGAVQVVDTSTDVVRSLGDLPGANGTSFGPRGARIAVATLHPGDVPWSQIYLVDVAGSERFRVKNLGPGQPIADVAWSPDGDLVAAGADRTLVVWDAATGELLYQLARHTDFITSIDWRPDPSRRVLVTGGLDGTARVWRIDEAGGTETMSLSSSEMTDVTGVAFSPDGTRVATWNDLTGPGIRIWDVSQAGSAEWANLPADIYGDVLFLSKRRLLASGGWVPGQGGSSVILWDIEAASQPRLVRTFDLPGYRTCCATNIDASSDGSTLAIFFWAEGTSVRDVATGDELFFVPQDRPDAVTPIDLSSDGRNLAVGMDGAVRILDRSGHQVGTTLREDGGFRIVGFAFTPDSRFIATESYRGVEHRVRIWDRERGIPLTEIRGDRVLTEIAGAGLGPAYSTYARPYGPTLTFDPSGRLIASGANRRLRIWNVETGAPVATMPRQPDEITDIAFSPDGALVATADGDGTLRLFDVGSQTQRLVLHASGFVHGLAFSPDGRMLASKSIDRTVQIWTLELDDLLEIARQNVTRSLTDEECRQYLHVEACPSS